MRHLPTVGFGRGPWNCFYQPCLVNVYLSTRKINKMIQWTDNHCNPILKFYCAIDSRIYRADGSIWIYRSDRDGLFTIRFSSCHFIWRYEDGDPGWSVWNLQFKGYLCPNVAQDYSTIRRLHKMPPWSFSQLHRILFNISFLEHLLSSKAADSLTWYVNRLLVIPPRSVLPPRRRNSVPAANSGAILKAIGRSAAGHVTVPRGHVTDRRCSH